MMKTTRPAPRKYYSLAEIREIERKAIEDCGIPVPVLMEKAGKAVAQSVLSYFKKHKAVKPYRSLIFCGGGNNGGDGFVAARHLKKRGVRVSLILLKDPQLLKGATAKNFQKVRNSVPFKVLPDIDTIKAEIGISGIIIDSIFGVGLNKKIGGTLRKIIAAINASKKPVLAVDIPSGLDAESGQPQGIAVRADWTVAMGLMKRAFALKNAARWAGKVELADIGFPKRILK